MTILDRARQAKHRAFVLRKRCRVWGKRLKFEAATAAFRRASDVMPYSYRPARYADTFLSIDREPTAPPELPRRVFAIWAGDNELTTNRERNLKLIEERLELPVELVTPATLHRWVLDDHPLHPAYQDLSFIHRSDYLRGYLMHHHGGGYIDIKEPLGSWTLPFAQMAADEDAWVTSYTTTDANWIGKLKGRIGLDILVRYRVMFGKCAFLMRSNTPLTAEWLAQMDAVLDANRRTLAQHPGGVYGDSRDYPLSWTDLLGRVLDPLTLKHHANVRYDDRLLLHFEDYR